MIDGRELLLWEADERLSGGRMRSLLLPSASSACFVSILTHPTGATSVITCSGEGLLSVWADVASHAAEPVHHQVLVGVDAQQHRHIVKCFTAEIPELAASAGPAFVGVLGAADGSLFFIQGSPQVGVACIDTLCACMHCAYMCLRRERQGTACKHAFALTARAIDP